MSDAENGLKTLGQNIRERREVRGVSQRQMALQVHIQQATMNKIELGQRSPTHSQAEEIAKFFEYELTELHLLLPEKYPAPKVSAA